MEYIDLREVGREGLKQIRRQVVRLKKMGKKGKKIEELTGVRQNRISEIWTAYQREGEASLERKKYGRKPGTHMLLEVGEQGEDPRNHHGKNAGRFRDTWQTVDAGTNEAIYPETVP